MWIESSSANHSLSSSSFLLSLVLISDSLTPPPELLLRIEQFIAWLPIPLNPEMVPSLLLLMSQRFPLLLLLRPLLPPLIFSLSVLVSRYGLIWLTCLTFSLRSGGFCGYTTQCNVDQMMRLFLLMNWLCGYFVWSKSFVDVNFCLFVCFHVNIRSFVV